MPELELPGGRLHFHAWGPRDGPLTICIPGLTSNCRAFEVIGERLAADGHHVVALDLRGRGHSETTPPGSYGWPAHARDVLAVAHLMGRDEPVDVMGHSMGAFVGMQAAADAPEAVRRLVLVDAAGRPEAAALGPIGQSVERLGALHESAAAFFAAVRAAGVVEPWGPIWERAYRHELIEDADSVRSRTSREAVMEDLEHGSARDPRELWARLRCPALLIRAARPLGDSGGFVLGAADRDAFAATVPGAEAIEVEANHYGVIADAATAEAIAGFLT
ncbi:MAG TPA: alpha/beta hydrolase [Thermoleophilaceae bacterium]|nr:alpha/beta hydrolase [Thermoleophilaceae bacterium]